MPKPLGSVVRAIDVMEYLAGSGPDGSSLAEISSDLDSNKATIHSTLATLRQRNWVAQDPVTARYFVGRAIDVFTTNVSVDDQLVSELRPALERISREFNELVHLGRLDGTSIYYIDKIEPDRAIRVVSKIGMHVPAVRTAIGRAILASSPDRAQLINFAFSSPEIAELDSGLASSLRDSVVDNCRRFDTEGWVQEIGENEEGIACVAVPIIRAGKPIAAVSVTTPIERLPVRVRPTVAAYVKAAIAV